MSTARKLGLAAAVLIASQLLSRVLGFARDAVIAALFGANGATDAFIAAFTIPDWLNYVLAGGTLSITFIPIYTRYLTASDEKEGNRVFSIIATAMGIVLVAAIVMLEIWTPEISRAYLRKLSPEHLELAIRLTRVLLPAQFFFYLGALSAATLFARHRFVAASFAPLLYNSGTILGGALLGRRLGIDSLAWGTLAGAVVGPFLVQQLAARRAGLRYFPSLRIDHAVFREWILKSLPLMIGVSLVYADDWIIRYFAAADAGAISCINYARKLVTVPIAVAGQAVGAASMPFFARLFAEKKLDELGRLVVKSARASSAIAALCGAGLYALAGPLVDLLFRRGAFTVDKVAPTAIYLQLFSVAIPLWGMQGILARAFYAAGDTLTPMVAGTAVTVTSIPIYWALFRAFGPNGLVIASGIGILLHTAALLVLLPRRVACDRASLMGGVARAMVLGAIAAAPAWAAARWLPFGKLHGHGASLAQSAVGGLVFVIVVMLLMKPLGVEDVAMLFDRLMARLSRRRA